MSIPAAPQALPAPPLARSPQPRRRRLLLLALVGIFACGAVMSLQAFTPQPGLAQRLERFPALPLPLPPGLQARELVQALTERQYRFASDSLGPQGLKPGIVQAVSPDRRITVFAFLDADGAIDRVRFRISATDAAATQLMEQADGAYRAAGWSCDTSAPAQVTYRQQELQVVVYRLFECDPDLPDEPFYWVLEARQAPGRHGAWSWLPWRR